MPWCQRLAIHVVHQHLHDPGANSLFKGRRKVVQREPFTQGNLGLVRKMPESVQSLGVLSLGIWKQRKLPVSGQSCTSMSRTSLKSLL
jgi:hypothetical protein